MSRLSRNLFHWALALAASFGVAHAGVVITGTRVIYPASEREVTVKLNNHGGLPALVQAWIDDGDGKTSAQSRAMPFTLLPPVFRIDPGKGQTLRMMYTREPLPEDRESVFWLNVLEIPPRATDEAKQEQSLLQMAFRSRIKIFFRPNGLAGEAHEAPALVQWKMTPDESRGGYALNAENPTVYHVNIAKASVLIAGKTYETEGGMIPPKSERSLPLIGLGRDLQAWPSDLSVIAINDYGALVESKMNLKP